MKNHLMKIHNQADVSNIPLLQAVSNVITDSDPSEIEPLHTELTYREGDPGNHLDD